MGASQTKQTSTFFGVWVIRAAFLLAILGWGVGFYGPPIYLAEVAQRTNWSLSLISLAVTLHFLVGTLVILNLPRLYARAGLPATTVCGAVLTAIGVVGWSTVQEPWQLFLAATLTGLGWVTMGAVAVNTIVAAWYHKNRPAALSKAYNGASVGGVIFSPLWVALIGGMGFAGAASIVGVMVIIIVLLLARYVFTKTPENTGQVPDGNGSGTTQVRHLEPSRGQTLPGPALWRNWAFITLSAGMAIGLFAQIGLLAHLFNIFSPVVGAQQMGWLMGLGTACAIGGRAIAARAVQQLGNRRTVAAGGYLIQAFGTATLLLFGADNVWLLTLGVMLFGSGIGNATSIPPLVAQSDFAPEDVPRVVALTVAIAQGTYAFAPAVFGLLQSNTHDYPGGVQGAFFAAAIGIQILAAAAYLAYRGPRATIRVADNA
ncbi:MFS transporter [Advenella sp. FME57]|uniref:MFS transporter n=1 Tax=Advenella sp. FME57 TaxID=2742604 RepID=UPI001866A9FD|nr:MFS transporter [Advenella sp. FME57]